jgi:hypothetical protein
MKKPKFTFEVTTCSGRGNKTWDTTLSIKSTSIQSALRRATKWLGSEPAVIVEITQID